MKTLILQRHGQADPYGETDFDRPLTDWGRNQISTAANRLKKTSFIPSLLLASPLLRAQQSAQIAAAVLGVQAETEPWLDGRLSAQGLLDFARHQLENYDCLMLVGHNPGVGIAAQLLSGNYIGFGTGAYAVFDMTRTESPKLLLRG